MWRLAGRPLDGRRRFYGTWNKFQRWQDLVKAAKDHAREEQMQRRYLPGGMYMTPETPQDALPVKDRQDMTKQEKGRWLSFDQMSAHYELRYLDYSREAMERHSRYQSLLARQYDQRFIPERHLFLGPDLAAAHFLVHRGISVKFAGDRDWYRQNARGEYSLPGRQVAGARVSFRRAVERCVVVGLHLEAIDASRSHLMAEGFVNLVDLDHVRMLSLAGCPHVTDWCLDRVKQFSGSLEMLDLSQCTRVSALGLSSLAALKSAARRPSRPSARFEEVAPAATGRLAAEYELQMSATAARQRRDMHGLAAKVRDELRDGLDELRARVDLLNARKQLGGNWSTRDDVLRAKVEEELQRAPPADPLRRARVEQATRNMCERKLRQGQCVHGVDARADFETAMLNELQGLLGAAHVRRQSYWRPRGRTAEESFSVAYMDVDGDSGAPYAHPPGRRAKPKGDRARAADVSQLPH